MTWQTPKQNWAMGDAPNNGDFNRIEGNIKHLSECTVNGQSILNNILLTAGDVANIVEVATYRDTTTNIAANGTLTKTFTFNDNHKCAIVCAIDNSFSGAVGIVLNKNLSIPSPEGVWVSRYEDGDGWMTRIGNSAAIPPSPVGYSHMLGDWIHCNASLNNKICTVTFVNNHQTTAQKLKANVNIIAI